MYNTTWSQPVLLCFQLLLASDLLLVTNKANITATNLYLFCAVLFVVSCHLRLSLVTLWHFHCLFFPRHFSLLASLWVPCSLAWFLCVKKSARMHSFSINIWPHDIDLNPWQNQLVPGDTGVFWVRDCVLFLALFWGGMTPLHLWLIVAPPQISAHCVRPPLLRPLPSCGSQLHPHCPARPRPPVSTTFSSHRLHLFIEIDFVAMMMEACIAAVGLSLN